MRKFLLQKREEIAGWFTQEMHTRQRHLKQKFKAPQKHCKAALFDFLYKKEGCWEKQPDKSKFPDALQQYIHKSSLCMHATDGEIIMPPPAPLLLFALVVCIYTKISLTQLTLPVRLIFKLLSYSLQMFYTCWESRPANTLRDLRYNLRALIQPGPLRPQIHHYTRVEWSWPD